MWSLDIGLNFCQHQQILENKTVCYSYVEEKKQHSRGVTHTSNSTSTVNAPEAATQTLHVKLFAYNPRLGVYKMICNLFGHIFL